MGKTLRQVTIVTVSTLTLLACAAPARRMDDQARQLGLSREVLTGTGYRHVVYHKAARNPSHLVHSGGAGGNMLHVYLDGDGTPWVTRTRIAADPTPRHPLVIRLMARDAAASLYLGRPCYHGQAGAPACHPRLWTSHRYGPEVVDSMTAALNRFLERANLKELVFIGYSGGGALAMLLAERFEQTRAVVTIAGNLDPARWAAWHGYTPLGGSLNPARRPPLRDNIVQLHFVGGRDRNVPPDFADFVDKQHQCANVILMPEFDHVCCWEATWPRILDQLRLARASCAEQ
jgi:pimeloyl-ACP methyl ester carboxylesterase